MQSLRTIVCTFGLAAMAALAIGGKATHAQGGPGPNAAPNPYHVADFQIQMPEGRKLGAPIGVEIDHRDGKTLWVYERCGSNTCVGSNVAPILKVDASGKVLANFGGGAVNWPHGF